MRTASVLRPRSVEVGVERPRHAAGRVLVEGDRLQQLAAADHRAADHVGVAAEVLRRAVDDEVGPERERLLQVRRGERVVDRQQRAGAVRQLGDGGDVEDLQERIGRRLDPDELRLRREDRREARGRGVVGVARRRGPRA